MKQKIYKNILATWSGVDYSPGIRFETSISNVDEAKALTKSNQTESLHQKQQIRCRRGSIKHLRITTRDLPVDIYYRRAKTNVLGDGAISI